MTTLKFEEDEVDVGGNVEPQMEASRCPFAGSRVGADSTRLRESATASQDLSSTCPSTPVSRSNGQQLGTIIAATLSPSERILDDLVRQTRENSILLRQALIELQELKEQMQNQRRYPFTVKTCGFERELVMKAKELFITHGPWLVQGALERIKEKVETLLGGPDKADAHHISSCVSYCKERYTLWRADIRKKVLNKKFNHLKITEFTQKLYAPFKSKEEDMKNAAKTAILLRKFASENGYFEESTKSDFWEKFVDFVNLWNDVTVPNKWAALRLEDESKYKESLSTTH